MKKKDFRGDLLTHRAEAQMLAETALRQVFPLLPQWGLQNDDWVGTQILLGGEAYVVRLSSWQHFGRAFQLARKGRRTPFVYGVVKATETGMDVHPETYWRKITRRSAVRTRS